MTLAGPDQCYIGFLKRRLNAADRSFCEPAAGRGNLGTASIAELRMFDSEGHA